ncbi:OLC1v1036006C1 [Oldenlandia corymbosa var. corymbosa]|uniref:OLC1v1036006C1 n=1 Tax=Oldenlandia corymbosa var. corymbosa TaxID=529605 RepID=A0AAV1CUD3_OLDCO|nr:OLC1v1036006C1 [Oldenlandia corymbosa var. corymbosa]
MAVEVNLENPLCQELDLRNRKQKVEYENLPFICAYCGRAGHLAVTCPFNPQKSPDLVILTAAGTSNMSASGGANDKFQATEHRRHTVGEWSHGSRFDLLNELNDDNGEGPLCKEDSANKEDEGDRTTTPAGQMPSFLGVRKVSARDKSPTAKSGVHSQPKTEKKNPMLP